MTARPEPRPALIRTPKGTVTSLTARSSSLAVDVDAVVKAGKKARKKGLKAADDPGASVDLTLALTKSDVKRLRRKAQVYGWTPEQAAVYVLRVWADS
jgi:hypothetical protein